MLYILLVVGLVLGVCICGALEFKDRCQLFEFAIKHSKDDINDDLDRDWLAFKATANIDKDLPTIKILWTDLVKGIAPYRHIEVLKLSAGNLWKSPDGEVEKKMLGYKIDYFQNVNVWDLLVKDYRKYREGAWFRWANVYLKFPRY